MCALSYVPIIGVNTQDVYTKCISSVISGVVQGLNATVFAYGSTGRYLRDMFMFSKFFPLNTQKLSSA